MASVHRAALRPAPKQYGPTPREATITALIVLQLSYTGSVIIAGCTGERVEVVPGSAMRNILVCKRTPGVKYFEK
jgi:hypothetical protein